MNKQKNVMDKYKEWTFLKTKMINFTIQRNIFLSYSFG